MLKLIKNKFSAAKPTPAAEVIDPPANQFAKGDCHHILAKLRTLMYETLAVSVREIDVIAEDTVAGNNPGLMPHLDTLTAFYALRESVAAEYLDEINANIDSEIIAHDAEPPANNDDFGKLMEGFISQAEQRYANSLKHLIQQLETLQNHLTGQTLNSYCMHPRAVYLPYKNSLASLPVPTQGKMKLCELFHQQLFSKLKELYRQANHIIAEGDLSPDGKFPGHFISEPATEEDVEPKVKHLSADEVDSMSTGEFFAPVEAELWAREAELRASQEREEDHNEQRHENNLNTEDETDIGSMPYQHYAVDRDELQNLLQIKYPSTGSAGTHHQRHQFITALTIVQRSEADSDTPLNSTEIISAAKCALYEAGSTDVTDFIEKEEKVIDFVTQTFETLLGDEGITANIKGLFARLQIPIIKLALLDAAFFQDPTHPGRQLLNKLASIGAQSNTIKPEHYTKLKSAVEHVINDFDSDIGVLKTALEEIESVDEIGAAKAREIEAKVRQEAKIRARRSAAKRIVISTLKHQLHGTHVPTKVKNFISQCWAHYMGLVHLEHGGKSPEWFDTISTLKQLIENSQPYINLQQIERITGRDSDFFPKITKQLSQTYNSRPEYEVMLDDIIEWFKKRGEKLRVDWEVQQHADKARAAKRAAAQTTPKIPADSTDANALDNTPNKDARVTKINTKQDQTSNESGNKTKDSTDNVVSETLPKKSPTEPTASPKETSTGAQEKATSDTAPEPVTANPIDVSELALQKLITSLPEEIRPNSWFEIYQGEERAKRRLKLSAILEDTAQLLFVDRTGRGILEMDLECFMEDYREGRSKVINDNNRFDDALSSVISDIRSHQS